MLTEELKKLSKSEKILLINDLWDEVSHDGDEISLTQDQEKTLDERYAQFLENPEEGKPWEEVKRELREKR